MSSCNEYNKGICFSNFDNSICPIACLRSPHLQPEIEKSHRVQEIEVASFDYKCAKLTCDFVQNFSNLSTYENDRK